MNRTSPTSCPAVSATLIKSESRVSWRQVTGNTLHIFREQSDVIVWQSFRFVRTRPKATLFRRLKAVITAIDNLICHFEISENSSIPSLLLGVSLWRAQRLHENLTDLYVYQRGKLDRTDLATLRSFYFWEVKDTVAQIGLDVESKLPRRTAEEVKVLCQSVEKAALEMADCFQ